MAKFLRTNGISNCIEEIIINAKEKIVLVSPYLKISRTYYERLQDASRRNVIIKIIYGKRDLSFEEIEALAELKNLELRYFDNLHAKCYFNEKEMVITSMNLYDFSEKNNREMGVLISREEDKTIFNQAVIETKSIIDSSELVDIQTDEITLFEYEEDSYESHKDHFDEMTDGFCIRCSETIQYNLEKPYCESCFSTWSQYKNPYFEEEFCHTCGAIEFTSMKRPECYDCYIENR